MDYPICLTIGPNSKSGEIRFLPGYDDASGTKQSGLNFNLQDLVDAGLDVSASTGGLGEIETLDLTFDAWLEDACAKLSITQTLVPIIEVGIVGRASAVVEFKAKLSVTEFASAKACIPLNDAFFVGGIDLPAGLPQVQFAGKTQLFLWVDAPGLEDLPNLLP